eukprot:5315566-Prymnesium_polylepis.1
MSGTSAACAPSNGDEDRWVKRYMMCPWPLLTVHMHARACQADTPRTCMPLPRPRHDTPTT